MFRGRVRPESRAHRYGKLAAIFLSSLLVLVFLQAFVVKLYLIPSASMAPLLNSSQESGEESWSGDRVLVNRLAFVSGGPVQGDVIVFRKNQDWLETRSGSGANVNAGSKDSPVIAALKNVSEFVGLGPGLGGILVKRVIAGPGDVISCCSLGGQIVVNGTPLDEPYVQNDFPFESQTLNCTSEPESLRCLDSFTVPANKYIVLGDNRSNSRDSLALCRGSAGPLAECIRYADRADIVGRVFGVIDLPSRPLFFL
jgi:signal peptidase I